MPTFVSAGTLTDTSQPITLVTVAEPSGELSGDVLIAQIIVYDSAAANVPSAPAGWNTIRHDAVTNSGNRMTSWLFYKVAGGSEPASYTWNIAEQYAAGVIGAWRGAASSPVDNASGATAGGNGPILATAPSLTPAGSHELQVYFYGAQSFTAPTITEPGAITSRANDLSTNEGFALAFGDLAAPAGGMPSPTYTAMGRVSASSSALVMSAQSVLLKPGP